MKKVNSLALVLVLALSMTSAAFAGEIKEEGQQSALMSVQLSERTPEYVVTIPADANISLNTLKKDIGSVGLGEGAQHGINCTVRVSVEKGDLENKENKQFTIPYVLKAGEEEFVYKDYTMSDTPTPLSIEIKEDDWNKAHAGAYEGVITFKVEYVEKVSEGIGG